jgi:hypothetical protein
MVDDQRPTRGYSPNVVAKYFAARCMTFCCCMMKSFLPLTSYRAACSRLCILRIREGRPVSRQTFEVYCCLRGLCMCIVSVWQQGSYLDSTMILSCSHRSSGTPTVPHPTSPIPSPRTYRPHRSSRICHSLISVFLLMEGFVCPSLDGRRCKTRETVSAHDCPDHNHDNVTFFLTTWLDDMEFS